MKFALKMQGQFSAMQPEKAANYIMCFDMEVPLYIKMKSDTEISLY